MTKNEAVNKLVAYLMQRDILQYRKHNEHYFREMYEEWMLRRNAFELEDYLKRFLNIDEKVE